MLMLSLLIFRVSGARNYVLLTHAIPRRSGTVSNALVDYVAAFHADVGDVAVEGVSVSHEATSNSQPAD